MAIYKDKNGTYYAQYKANGVRRTKRGFDSKAEAKKYEVTAKYEEDNPLHIMWTTKGY